MTPSNFTIIDPEGQKPRVGSMKGVVKYLKNAREAIQELFSAFSSKEAEPKTSRIQNESDSEEY